MDAKDSNVLNAVNSSQQGGSMKRGSKRSLVFNEDQENDRPVKRNEEKKSEEKRKSTRGSVVPKMENEEEEDSSSSTNGRGNNEKRNGRRSAVPNSSGGMVQINHTSPPREPGVKDGRIIGGPIDPTKRDQMEQKSCILYPYPRRNPFTQSGRKYNSKRLLDLIVDGEVDGDVETEGNVEIDTDYHINGLIYVDDESALINWHGFKYPTWQGKSIVKRGITDGPLQEYNRRRRIMDKVWANIQQTEKLMQSDLMLHYRNIALMQTEDYSQYVTNPGIVYLSGLLKREQQINDYIDLYYKENYNSKGPTILFVDATNFRDSSIPTFEYIMNVEETENAKNVIEESVTSKRNCKCGETCKALVLSCCAFKSNSKLAYIKKNVLGNITKHGERIKDDDSSDDDELIGRIEKSHDFVDQYECGDACSCTPSSCQQRVMQRGHSHTLVIFRHHLKSWTVRAGNDISQGSFVCEYTGKMMTVKEAAMKDKTYQMHIDVRTNEGKNGRLVIDANEKGNEGRFFAHSCEPNLFPLRIHFDIEGRPKRHVGFFAGRDIKEGEELTFDYYADVQDLQQFHERTTLAKFTCRCGSRKCRETAYQKMIKQQKNDD